VDRWPAGYLLRINGKRASAQGSGHHSIAPKKAGAEPDKSWCLGSEKKFPDLVVEIALTSGGVEKLDVYRQFRVAEVWFWRHNGLEAFGLGSAGYVRLRRSRLFPGLDFSLIEKCVGISSWRQARQTFRAGLAEAK
jgi:Uma2 family endonuclease